ncbi:MAG: orotate phosphoribosyltransferase [Clostridia bacterium]|nr:orotate phosphoribosyltransferase [Clostridia bacterium]
MNNDIYELISARSRKVTIQIVEGHFATQHSHVSHFIDMTRVKSESVSARAAAKLFAARFVNEPLDTVITLERTKMIGAFLADELMKTGMNVDKNIAVVTPEITNEKLFLRDNLIPYVKHKRVLLLTATATTGMTLKNALEGIVYYGGTPAGAAAVFGGEFGEKLRVGEFAVPVERLFFAKDIGKYDSYAPNECPLCKAGVKVDAVVNSYGYSKL